MTVTVERGEAQVSAGAEGKKRANWTLQVWKWVAGSDIAVLVALALARILLHTLVNNRYGFHRDELLTMENTRHLAWGYVVYPPITPFLAWLGMQLFGPSLRAFRVFAAIAQGLAMLLTGLATRELGGKREAQVIAAVAAGISGLSMTHGSFLSYSSFDFPCWILVAYCVIRLLKSEDARWWVAIGGAIGLGMMAKYGMAFFAVGVVGGMLLTPARRYLKSGWLWCGAAVGLIVMLPNVAWQMEHQFVSLEFLKSIHARDIGLGWTDYFLLNQLWKCMSVVGVPLSIAGLWYLFGTAEGERYRMIGWMYVLTCLELWMARGRDYYLAPAYPMLLAAGAVWGERWVSGLREAAARSVRQNTWISLAIAATVTAATTWPIAPVGSAWFRTADAINGGNFSSEVGWPDYVRKIAEIRDRLPTPERAGLGILAGDEGEAGAVNLYGPAYGLPRAISGMNSHWYRGYGEPPPETVIVLGEHRDFGEKNFESCELAGRATNPYGIENSSLKGWDEIFVCRQLRWPWPEFWKRFRNYG